MAWGAPFSIALNKTFTNIGKIFIYTKCTGHRLCIYARSHISYLSLAYLGLADGLDAAMCSVG